MDQLIPGGWATAFFMKKKCSANNEKIVQLLVGKNNSFLK